MRCANTHADSPFLHFRQRIRQPVYHSMLLNKTTALAYFLIDFSEHIHVCGYCYLKVRSDVKGEGLDQFLLERRLAVDADHLEHDS